MDFTPPPARGVAEAGRPGAFRRRRPDRRGMGSRRSGQDVSESATLAPSVDLRRPHTGGRIHTQPTHFGNEGLPGRCRDLDLPRQRRHDPHLRRGAGRHAPVPRRALRQPLVAAPPRRAGGRGRRRGAPPRGARDRRPPRGRGLHRGRDRGGQPGGVRARAGRADGREASADTSSSARRNTPPCMPRRRCWRTRASRSTRSASTSVGSWISRICEPSCARTPCWWRRCW